jgi:hypothetical protein
MFNQSLYESIGTGKLVIAVDAQYVLIPDDSQFCPIILPIYSKYPATDDINTSVGTISIIRHRITGKVNAHFEYSQMVFLIPITMRRVIGKVLMNPEMEEALFQAYADDLTMPIDIPEGNLPD